MATNFIINLFGTGIRYWVCEIPIPLYEEMNKIKLNKKVEWENLLFDFDFLKHFGFDHWSELSSHPEQTGFLLDPQNRIEIKQGAKFIARFRANELMNNETLFPLYQSSQVQFQFPIKPSCQSIVLVQFEKGLVGKYKFETNLFSMDHLSFTIQHLKKLHFLSSIALKENTLYSSTDDTVATGCRVFQISNTTS